MKWPGIPLPRELDLVEFDIALPDVLPTVVSVKWLKPIHEYYQHKISSSYEIGDKIKLQIAFINFLEALSNFDHIKIKMNADQRRVIIYSIQSACMSIFLFGQQSNVEDKLAKLVEMHIKSRQSAGGKASGAKRGRNKDDEWRKRATELAVKFRAEYPNLSQQKLADKISDCWGAKACPVGSEMMRKHIGGLQRTGLLKRRLR